MSAVVCILNNFQPTRYSAATNTFTAIYLSPAHPILHDHLEWKVIDNPYGRDYSPILKRNATFPSVDICSPQQNLAKANWPMFTRASLHAYECLDNCSIEDITGILSGLLIHAATVSIPKTSGRFPNGVFTRLTESPNQSA